MPQQCQVRRPDTTQSIPGMLPLAFLRNESASLNVFSGWTQSLTLNGQCKQPFGCERGRCLCATSSSTGARKTAKFSIKKRAPSSTDTRPWNQNHTSLEDANSAPTVRGDMTVTDLGDGFHSRITLATWSLRRNHSIDRRLERANEPFRSTSHDAQK